jgi:hypothetical protein
MLLLTWVSKSWWNAVVLSEVVLLLFGMVGWSGLQLLKLGMRFAGRGLLYVEIVVSAGLAVWMPLSKLTLGYARWQMFVGEKEVGFCRRPFD